MITPAIPLDGSSSAASAPPARPPASAPSAPRPDAASALVAPVLALIAGLGEDQKSSATPGYDLSEISAIDLTQFRNSNLPGLSYLLLLLPVIGWIALACLKYNYVSHHNAAEEVMVRSSDYRLTLNQKIHLVAEAIKVSGPHAWQYQLELARLHLLNGNIKEAGNDLAAASRQRGKPDQTGLTGVERLGLRSFRRNWVRVTCLHVDHYTGQEALLNAAFFAANKQYTESYDAYNEVQFYAGTISNTRAHQCKLVDEMNKNPRLLNKRGLEIVTAEK